MFILLSLRWWYSAGWRWAWQHAVTKRIQWCLDTFSLSTLVRTLFAPFKQTFAGNVRGSLGDHFRAFIDRTISRIIGFLVRSILIFSCLVCMILAFVTGLILVLSWGFIPLLPVIGLVLFSVGADK